MKNLNNKKKFILLVIFIIISFLTTLMTNNVINTNINSKINIKSKNTKLQDPASEYTSLNSRITSLENKYNILGTRDSAAPSAVSLAHGVVTKVATISDVSPGTYLIIGTGRFNSKTGGFRYIDIRVGGTDIIEITARPVSGGYTIINAFKIAVFSSSADIDLYAFQNSGSALSVTPRLNIRRLK